MDEITSNFEDSPFERIKRTNTDGYEFWSSRDIQKILGYISFRNFLPVIKKAKEACENSGQNVDDHFAQIRTLVETGSGAKRLVQDYKLSRYACYLIIQNADPAKEIVALGQTYFAVQTRKQELFEQANEDDKRYILREEMKKHNKQLADTVYKAGVKTGYEFAIFQNHGYQGLYGGLTEDDIHRRKGLKKSQKILDHMGSTELAANLFRATQTEEKIRREKIRGKVKANQAHFEVGKIVRKTIQDIGGTMPEDLPVSDSIKKIERRKKKELKDT